MGAIDPYHDIDAQPDAAQFVQRLEERGQTRAQAAVRRRFLRFAGIRSGQRVLDIGCGSGVVTRDLARMVGVRGHVVGADPSRRFLATARRLARCRGLHGRIGFRVADGRSLPFRDGRFDAVVAVTVLLHVDTPEAVVAEMVRVTRPGGVVAVQDQDFGTLAVTHPDPLLSARILDGVVRHLYAEPFSGRRLPGLLRGAGLARVRLRTDVYQDTTLEPYTRAFLERRAENAVRLGMVDAESAQRWLDGLAGLARAGRFVMTLNFYGARGVRP